MRLDRAARLAPLGLFPTGWTRPLIAGAFAPAAFVMFLRNGRPFNDGKIGVVERVGSRRAIRLLRGFAVS